MVGIANAHSIAYGCAKAFRELGAELAITFLNDKAKPHVEPLAQELEAAIFRRWMSRGRASWMPSSNALPRDWGQLDILVHSIAFAPKEDLQGGLLDCSANGIRDGHGHLLPLLHPHGRPGGARS